MVCEKDFLFLLLYGGLGEGFEGNLLKGDEVKDIKNQIHTQYGNEMGWEVCTE